MATVAIVMGSDSDWDYVQSAAKILKEFGVDCEVRVMSAHRTPHIVAEYATNAQANGTKVFIAAAGGAAHLAGVVAAHTCLPVIGLPVPVEPLGGLDSLLATVQMPGDVPVASVAVGKGGPKNAGLFAIQMLALSDEGLANKFKEFKSSLVEKISGKNEALQARI